MTLAKTLLISVSILTLISCGGGGGGGTTASSGTVQQSTSIAEGYVALSAGALDNFSNSSTLIAVLEKVRNTIKNHRWNFVSTAYASGRCSTNASKLIGAKSATEWQELSLKDLDTDSESTVDDSTASECITGLQDSANYIAFVADNLSNTNSKKCEINLIRKSDSKIFCINTDIPTLLNVNSPQAYATYEMGVKSTIKGGADYAGDYAMNSGGYKSVVTRNGKYLFSPFTITLNNTNYVGITRIKLTTKSKPQANVVWLKQQTVTNGVYSHFIRGFLGLETGDLIVDYINNYDPSDGNFTTRPLDAAVRFYVAVDSTQSNPNNHPGLVLWEGAGPYYNNLWGVGGELLNYLFSNDPTNSVDSNNSPVVAYVSGRASKIYGIGSDPSATDRSVIVKLASNASRAGPMLDLFKVTIGVSNGQASVSTVDYLGPTNSYYPLAVIGNNIYMWNRTSNYTAVGGSSRSLAGGVVAHPLNGGSSAVDDLIYPAGDTFTYSTYATKNSFFVLEGFGGYFGGNLVGNNKIYQVKVSNNTPSVTNIDIGRISDGLFTIKTISVNPLTDQLQVSGSKKSSISDYSDNTQWSAFISSVGVKQLRIFSNTSALADDKPVLAIKDASGSTVSYTSSE